MGVTALCLFAGLEVAWAGASITLSGLLGDKALLSIDGGPPRVMRVGDVHQSVRLVAVADNQVVVEEAGRRRTIVLGFVSQGGGGVAREDEGRQAVLRADGSGHFLASGRVNGSEVRFVVDTGASLVTLPKSIASRAGVSLQGARPTRVATAGGVVDAWQVRLNKVGVGGIQLHLVDALVLEDRHLPVALLGMSFLNRTEMRQEGGVLTLSQRY